MASFHTTRNKTGRGPLGCLIPLIASTILLAAGVTFISWFALDDGDLEPEPPASISKKSGVTKGLERTPSIPAIVQVIETEGFARFGEPESIELGTQSQVTHKFRRENQEIHVTIYTLKSAQDVDEKLQEVRDDSSALTMGNRVVSLDAPSDNAQALLPPLADRLETYQTILNQE